MSILLDFCTIFFEFNVIDEQTHFIPVMGLPSNEMNQESRL